MSAVHVLPYSAQWPEAFTAVRTTLLEIFDNTAVAVEHIGSTAVPGLSAKPVIDVLLGAPSLAVIEQRIAALGARGFEYVPKHERVLPQRRYFVPQPPVGLRVHVHGVETGGRLWREHLTFRDALRGDAQLRARYQALKLQLAAEHAGDKAAYTEAKAPFVREAIDARLRDASTPTPACAEPPP